MKEQEKETPIIGALPPRGASVSTPQFIVYDSDNKPVARAFRWPAARDFVAQNGGRIWDALDAEWLDD